MTQPIHVTCSHCLAKNRLPADKLNDAPNCGKCKQKILSDNPIELGNDNFQRFIQNNDLPVVVDFWASWCGPCQMMAPVFASVAGEMKTVLRFAKVDTEAAQQIAATYAIRSIPSLIVFKGGKEIARHAGAMDKSNLTRWLRQF